MQVSADAWARALWIATLWIQMFDITAKADAGVVNAVANWGALSPLLLTAGLCVSAGRAVTAVKWP